MLMGTWTLAAAQLQDLSLSVPAGSYAGYSNTHHNIDCYGDRWFDRDELGCVVNVDL